MTEQIILDIVQNAIYTIIVASAPPLLIGLIVGFIVSIFQTVTSINEQTLAFIPKILAVFLSLIIFGNFMSNHIEKLVYTLYVDIGRFLK